MSLRLEDIKAPIAREMQEFEPRFRASMKTRVLLLDKIMSYIVKRKGKQMRPMFVFLSAGTCGKINDSTFRGASLIELVHTATSTSALKLFPWWTTRALLPSRAPDRKSSSSPRSVACPSCPFSGYLALLEE